MKNYIELSEIDRAAEIIRAQISVRPHVGMILGSGLGPLAEEIERATIIPYGEIPSWPVSTVEGHQGQLVIGSLQGQDVLVMQGRAHFYEGYSMQEVTFPIRIFKALGISKTPNRKCWAYQLHQA